MMKEIYLDNAATTPLKKEVLQEMMPCLTEEYGNPSALYHLAQRARGTVAKARTRVAAVIGASPDEIYFTSGGTEADNWAIKAVFDALGKEKPHIITSAIEHHAVLETCHYLEKHGAQVTYLPVERNGRVASEKLANAVTEKTCLISIMTANNETGILQPVREMAEIAAENHILFHTDAVQAYGHIPLSVGELGVDLMSMSAHKIGGPKGCGALYIKKGIRIQGMMQGGMQEHARRAGTENVAGIVGFGKAAQLAMLSMDEASRDTAEKRDYLAGRILKEIPDTSVNGDGEKLPGHLNISFHHLDGESLLIYLDRHGIACSAGSACASGSLSPSHVLMAMGLPYGEAHASIRLSLSSANTREELDYVVEILKEASGKMKKTAFKE